ncbi:MAG: efflux RND transporter periplasmic adaptor subunit [Gammaproteobacteria bacterium]|nr:efflux RND transporter periplasmic adaptor subunit [Gammaproteobacteria bacterium]
MLSTASTFRLEQSLCIGFIASRHSSSKIISDMLIKSGHHIDIFLGLQEALPQVTTGKYDLILIMVEKGAEAKQCEELIRFVRQQKTPEIYSIPLVVITEFDSAMTLENLFLAGASDVIILPISEAELHNRLHQVIFLVPESIFEGRRSEKERLEIENINEPDKLTEKNTKPSRKRGWYIIVFIGLVLGLIAIINMGHNTQAPEREDHFVQETVVKKEVKEVVSQPEIVIKPAVEEPKTVHKTAILISTVRPELGSLIQNRDFSGRVVSEEQWAVRSKTSGKIARVFVDVGERVSKKQVIAVLESKKAVTELKNAQISLRKAKAFLQLATDKYETTLERYRQGQGNKPRLREAEVSQHNAKTEQKMAEKAYRDARIALENTRITAKFDGVISSVFFEKNKMINKNDILFNLEKSSKKGVELFLEAKQKPDIAVNNSVTVFTDRDESASPSWDEKVVAVRPVVDASGVTSAWRVQLTLTNDRLRYGQQVHVNLPILEKEEVVKVHTSNVINKKTQPFIPINNKGVVKYQPVKLGLQMGDYVEIKQGLVLDDEIIVSPELLDEGVSVRTH